MQRVSIAIFGVQRPGLEEACSDFLKLEDGTLGFPLNARLDMVRWVSALRSDDSQSGLPDLHTSTLQLSLV